MRGAVAHHDLDVIEILVEHALEGADDMCLGIAHNKDDRCKRSPHGTAYHVRLLSPSERFVLPPW